MDVWLATLSRWLVKYWNRFYASLHTKLNILFMSACVTIDIVKQWRVLASGIQLRIIRWKSADCRYIYIYDLRFSYRWLWRVLPSCDVMPCILLKVNGRFGGLCSHFQGQSQATEQGQTGSNERSFCLHGTGFLLGLLFDSENVSMILWNIG